MNALLHSDINSPKPGLLYLTGQPCCKKGSSAKVKDGIINLTLRNYLDDRYTHLGILSKSDFNEGTASFKQFRQFESEKKIVKLQFLSVRVSSRNG
jgi:hypothetical protein